MGQPQFTIEPPSAAAQQFTIEPPQPSLTDEEKGRLAQGFAERPWWRKVLGLGSSDPEIQKLAAKGMETARGDIEEGLRDYYSHNPGGIWAMGTASNVAQGTSELSQGELKKGLHHLIKGATIGASPLIVPAIASAPLATAGALATGTAGATAAGVGASIAGGDEDAQQLASDIGGIVGGMAGGGVARLSLKTLPAIGRFANSIQGTIAEDALGAASPRAANTLRLLGRLSKAVPQAATDETHPATRQLIQNAIEELHGLDKPAPYRLSGSQLTDATTVMPRRVLGPERQLPAPRSLAGSLADLSAAPASAAPATTTPVAGASTIPRTTSGEGVITQALTALDKPTLLRIARSRGINTTQEANLMPSKAEASLVKKISADMSPDELAEAREVGLELSRNKPVQGPEVSQQAGQEAWHYKVVKQFFPDVELPKAMLVRAQKTIAQRPDYSAVYQQAAKQSLPNGAPEAAVKAKAVELQAQDENLEAILEESIKRVKAKK